MWMNSLKIERGNPWGSHNVALHNMRKLYTIIYTKKMEELHRILLLLCVISMMQEIMFFVGPTCGHDHTPSGLVNVLDYQQYLTDTKHLSDKSDHKTIAQRSV